jgi:hypothetical protein
MRDGQVTKMHGRFEVDSHFFHIKRVCDFDLSEEDDQWEPARRYCVQKKKLCKRELTATVLPFFECQHCSGAR